MKPSPSGRLVQSERGRDLVLERTFSAPIEDVWASITEPERTARWIGRWNGDGAAGETVQLTMGFEEGAPVSDVRIEACEPPRRLMVAMDDASGAWLLEAELSETGGITTLVLTHHLDDQADPGNVGPGWEYYLDRLVAARDGAPEPEWGDYYPAQKDYYESGAASS